MNILILSRNTALYSTQSLVVAARRRGHYVRVADHIYCDLIMEKNQLEVYYNQVALKNFDAIIPRIGSTATDYGAAVIRQFESNGIYTVTPSDALLRARNKLTSLQLLAANNIPIPNSMVSNNSLLLPGLLNKLGTGPWVIKLINSTQGIGVILSESKKNAESVIEAMQRLREKFIVQKFIKEAKGADIRLFVVDGRVVAAMKRQAKPGEFRSNLHRGASSVEIVPTNKEKEIAIKAARLMGLSVAGVDVLRSRSGPLILEVNASPGLEGIESTTKIDIAGEIIQMVERNVRKT